MTYTAPSQSDAYTEAEGDAEHYGDEGEGENDVAGFQREEFVGCCGRDGDGAGERGFELAS